MGRIGAPELILILAIALVIFGPSKLPEIGKSIGEAMGQFKAHANKVSENIMDESKKDEDKKDDEKKG